MIPHHDTHVRAWVRHHARQLSRKALTDGFQPAALHEYADADGLPLFWRIRLKHPDSGDKWIRPMRRIEGGGFDLKQPEFPDGAPLYRLPELAARDDAPVWIVEGEACADALVALGLTATTSGGADSASRADWQPLVGRAVAVWPDNDEAGRRYAEAVAAILRGLGCRVAVLDVAALDLPAKADCVDWLEAHPGATAADVLALLPRDAPEPDGDQLAPDIPLAHRHGGNAYTPEIRIERGDALQIRPVRWLWPGWLAAGKLHILGGAPGTGKTTLALAMAATVTTGGVWPDGKTAPLGNVVIWSGEDDPADTLLPRLFMSGGDQCRAHFIRDVLDADGARGFDPARDMRALADALDRIGDVRLLIVDPIVSAVAGDSHKNAEVRRALAPLVELAERIGCALVGITHFSKGTAGRDPTERITGSLAFGALARVVLVAAKHQTDDGNEARRVLLRAKSNIGSDDGGFAYALQQGELAGYPGVIASCAVFGEAVEGAARDILAEADATDDRTDGDSLGDAKRFLLDLLADGPVSSKQVRADADGAGHSWRTVQRAQKALGIEAAKEGMRGPWFWRLPLSDGDTKNAEERQENQNIANEKAWHSSTILGDLRENSADVTPEYLDDAEVF